MTFLIESVFACIFFTAIVVSACLKDPLSFVDDFPPSIGERCRKLGLVPQKRHTGRFGIVLRKLPKLFIISLILGITVYFINGATTFSEGALTSYALWLVVDWWDAIVIDCIWACHSRKVIIAGTEDLEKDYKDYRFHIKMSLVGMLLGIPATLLAGAFTWLSVLAFG